VTRTCDEKHESPPGCLWRKENATTWRRAKMMALSWGEEPVGYPPPEFWGGCNETREYGRIWE